MDFDTLYPDKNCGFISVPTLIDLPLVVVGVFLRAAVEETRTSGMKV